MPGLFGQLPFCTACRNWQHAKSICVPSRGSPNPIVMFIGEGPGKDEDLLNQTFVGRAGEELDKLLHAAGINPAICRWGNIVKCIPWGVIGEKVRAPAEDEIDACSQYLDSEIRAVDPVYIVPLGGTAASYFLGKDTKITSVRGRRQMVDIPTIRFRYGRLQRWLQQNGIQDDKMRSETEPGRLRVIERAIEVYKYVEHIKPKKYTIFPTWHPAAMFYGNENAKPELMYDLNTLASFITGDTHTENYKLLTTVDDVLGVLRKMRTDYRAGLFKYADFDFESNSLRTFDLSTYITTMSITVFKGESFIIPWDHHESPFKKDFLQQKAIRYELNSFFEEVPVVGHNFKYDMNLGYPRGFRFPKIYDDTELMAWTLYNDTIEHGLDYLVSRFTDLKVPKQEMREAQKLMGGDEAYNTDNFDLDLVARYNGGDTDGSKRLCDYFEPRLVEEGLLQAHRTICVPALLPTQEMEANGVPVDQSVRSVLDKELKDKMNEYVEDLRVMGVVGDMEQRLYVPGKKKQKKFSLTSPQQVSTIVYEICGFAPSKYGKPRKKGKDKGKSLPSADKHVLQAFYEESNERMQQYRNDPSSVEYQIWSFKHATLHDVIEYKVIQKMHSSYVDNLPEHLYPHGYVHCNFGIRHTASGRFQCNDPSLHTIPFHSSIKRMFISRFQGGLILSADASQMELRMFSMVTKDPALVKVFQENRDVHRMIASRVLHIPEDKVLDDDRRRIKTVVFGMLYGRGPRSIAAQEGISRQEAQALIDGVFNEFPNIRQYIQDTHDLVRRTGKVNYINGFRRLIPVDPSDRSKAERQSVNTSIQGPASDMTVIGMINMYRAMKLMGCYSKHWEFKHDDLAFDVAPGELMMLANMTRKEMVERPTAQLPFVNVPLRVDYEVGINWGQLVGMKILDRSTLEFSGEEEHIDALVERMMSWTDKPELSDRTVKEKEKPKVVRSLMKVASEMIKYNFVTLRASFPPTTLREPVYSMPPVKVIT